MYDHEENNYQNDFRVRAAERAGKRRFDEKRMVLLFTVTEMFADEDGTYHEEVEVALPAKFEVCPTCDGKGTHVNPSIDASGISSSDFDEWGDEDREGYMNGTYDVACYDCGGKRVIPAIDETEAKAKDPAVFKRVMQWLKEEAEFERMSAMERAMGA